jgi:hypothetical protein
MQTADGTLRVLTIPAADSKSYTTAKNVGANITLSAGGISSIDFALSSTPSFGTLSGTMPNLTYTLTQNFTGTDSFGSRIADTSGNQTVGTITINVLSGVCPISGNTYTGLIVGPDFQRSGPFTLTKSGNSVTGSIIYGAQNCSFSGVFDANGRLSTTINRGNGLTPPALELRSPACTTSWIARSCATPGDARAATSCAPT